jgi:ribosomal protein S18 acetylase RimI-like enzyme
MSVIDGDTVTRPARRADRSALNRVLSVAFLDDPVFAWLVPDRDERARLLPGVFDAFADAFARHDQTHAAVVAGGVVGVGMWAPPGVAPVHPDDEAAFGSRLDSLAAPHMERIGACMAVFEAAHPAEPAWYLQFLATDPGHQGRGIGSALLRAVLDAADRAGEPAYLEATSERNRALYERHGFASIGDLVLPDGPTAYAMWRSPRPAPRVGS